MNSQATEPSKDPFSETLKPAGASATQAFFAGLCQNLRSGAAAAVFRRVTGSAFRVTPGLFIGLVVLNLVLLLAYQFLAVGTNGHFNIRDLPHALFFVPASLLLGYVAARLSARPKLTLALPIAVTSVGLVIGSISVVLRLAIAKGWLSGLPAHGSFIGWGIFFWWFAAVACVCMRLAEGGTRRDLSRIGAAAWLLLAMPHWYLPSANLWLPTPGQQSATDEEDSYAAVSEQVFYGQNDLLDRRLRALKPSRKGVEDLYFVGFGGDASQDVFRKEVEVVQKLFDQRFDTAGRSLNLVNSLKTLHEQPIASATALQRTLKQIGGLMNKDEDVLFLYLTLHGSKDHELAVNFWPLELDAIDPPMLKRMLDESGIKWRVLAISACYAGGFVEPLKDDHTLIVTAADAKHTSFGCSNESDFTYFGKAYFDEELRKTYSFAEAFTQARKSITAREKSEGFTPSNPQIHVGRAMKGKLSGLEAALSARTGKDTRLPRPQGLMAGPVTP